MFGIGNRQRKDNEKLLISLERLEKTVKEVSAKEEAEKISGRQKKQENMLEEILGLVDEYGAGLSKLAESREKERNQSEKQEEKLLDLIMLYEEYLRNIQAFGSKNDKWQQDMQENWSILHLSVKRLREQCGLIEIADDGTEALPERDEVVEQRAVSEKSLHNHVAETIISGWIYKGRIIRKAKVIIYKFMEENNGCDCRN